LTGKTFFAPAGRADEYQLLHEQQSIAQAAFITPLLGAVPDMILVLNKHRQIVSANKRLLSLFGVADQSVLMGMRPGEAVSCVHSGAGPDGCGTSETCSACGALLATLACQQTGEQAEGECRIVISRDRGTALDFEVTATPFNVAGIDFTIFALKDIGSHKRRQVLERTFFHDILNTVGGIKGVADLLSDSDNLTSESEAEYKQWMVDLSDSLIEEITQQRHLLAAEQGEYVPQMKEIDLSELLQEVKKLYGSHIRTPNRSVHLEEVPVCRLTTDRHILRRIVGNMVLNALEATPPGGSIRVSVAVGSGETSIQVANAGEIPKDVQLRLFKRSFSTKGDSGRGIGTYSMKLFGERYLGGKVGFHCLNGDTVFFITLPLEAFRVPGPADEDLIEREVHGGEGRVDEIGGKVYF
jgi:Signal transduction histidine kinase